MRKKSINISINREDEALELHKNINNRQNKLNKSILDTQVPETKESGCIELKSGKANVLQSNTTKDCVRFIKLCMDMANWKQKDLVNKTGISNQYISRLLSDKIPNAGFNHLSKIYAALGYEYITVKYIQK